MAKLKLPRPPRVPADDHGLPPHLRWDAPPPPTALVLLGRREFLKAVALVLAALAMPFTGARRALAAARGRFLTRAEFRTLEALCDRIIPPDSAPGGKRLGAAVYIDRFLAAFDHRVPLIYAGGPFSHRNPYPNFKRGVPSHRRPPDSFRRFIPLSRVHDIRWRAELFGSDSAPGAGFNDAALGPLKGLRTLYRESLAKVDQVAAAMKGKPFARLSGTDQDAVVTALDSAFAPDARRFGSTFMDLLIQHTIEGCFGAPEYGGNRGTAGWKLIGLEGDSQPLGYSIFSRNTDDYRERADHPVSTVNPDEAGGALPLTQDGQNIQAAIARLASLAQDC